MKENICIPFVTRNFCLDFAGQFNGYVAVPPTSKFFGKTYHDDIVDNLRVHGGITFSEPVTCGERTATSRTKIRPEFVGKIHPVAEGAIRLDRKNGRIPADWWIIGFDTKHDGDTQEKWNKTSVAHETFELQKQILKADGLWDDIMDEYKENDI